MTSVLVDEGRVGIYDTAGNIITELDGGMSWHHQAGFQQWVRDTVPEGWVNGIWQAASTDAPAHFRVSNKYAPQPIHIVL